VYNFQRQILQYEQSQIISKKLTKFFNHALFYSGNNMDNYLTPIDGL
jgi:hypothetical protein